MTTIIPKILLMNDEFRDTARILYSYVVPKEDDSDRWDLNNLIHLLELIWMKQYQVINFQAAVISKDQYSECCIVDSSKDNNGIGNFRISPIKVACCLFRWPKLSEIRRIASVPWCKAKLNSGINFCCLNPYHYQAKLAHYEFQYVQQSIAMKHNQGNNQDVWLKNDIAKVKFMKNKIFKNIQENHILINGLNTIDPTITDLVPWHNGISQYGFFTKNCNPQLNYDEMKALPYNNYPNQVITSTFIPGEQEKNMCYYVNDKCDNVDNKIQPTIYNNNDVGRMCFNYPTYVPTSIQTNFIQNDQKLNPVSILMDAQNMYVHPQYNGGYEMVNLNMSQQMPQN